MDSRITVVFNIYNIISSIAGIILSAICLCLELNVYYSTNENIQPPTPGSPVCDVHSIRNSIYICTFLDAVVLLSIVTRLLVGGTYFSNFEDLSERTKNRMSIFTKIQQVLINILYLILFIFFFITGGYLWTNACWERGDGNDSFYGTVNLYLIFQGVRSGICFVVMLVVFLFEACLTAMERSANNNRTLNAVVNEYTEKLHVNEGLC
ncbi:MTC6 [Acrasis kona]|uniref:MTC6 n=1 Tax=Acrasis kona TaxID=1008807 RepID=A0AAW2Z3G6_9EUKA